MRAIVAPFGTVTISCSILLAVADLHLGAASRPHTADRFLRLLAEAPNHADALVINGDLFDFWFGWPGVQPPEGAALLPALGALARRMPVQLIGGNHDRWGDGGWATQWGLHWAAWTATLQVGGQRVVCEHGDGLVPGSRAKRWLHSVVRSRVTQTAVGLTPPRLMHPLVRRFGPSLDGAPTDNATLTRETTAQAMAAAAWLELHTEVDWLVLGHTHRAHSGTSARGSQWCNPGAFAFDGGYALLNGRDVKQHQLP